MRGAITRLMTECQDVAAGRGASAGDGAIGRAVQVVDKKFYLRGSYGNLVPVEITESDRIGAMVSRISWSRSPICLLAVAVANSVEAEPAAIDFQPFTDRLIYGRGKVVATRRINGGASTEQLFGGYAYVLSLRTDLPG